MQLDIQLDRNRRAPAEAPRCGSFQLPGDSAPKARKGKHVRCEGDGVERVSHVGKPGCGEEVERTASFRRPYFRRGGGTLQGAGHPLQGQERGQVGAWPRGPASPASSVRGSRHTGRCCATAGLQGHGSQSCLNPSRARLICRLTGGPGKTNTNQFRVGAGGRRKRGAPPLLHNPSPSPGLSAIPSFVLEASLALGPTQEWTAFRALARSSACNSASGRSLCLLCSR